MVLDRHTLTAAEIAERTGWELKPEGACKGHQCVPLPGIDSSGPIDLSAFADAMDMPLVADVDHGLWALGPRSSGSVLDSAKAPDIVLDDFGGDAFDLASLRGRKVLLIAWASW